MMCALFSTHLLLGTLREDRGKINVVAMIRTADCDLGSANDKSGKFSILALVWMEC